MHVDCGTFVDWRNIAIIASETTLAREWIRAFLPHYACRVSPTPFLSPFRTTCRDGGLLPGHWIAKH
jgi:hypothetical protein